MCISLSDPEMLQVEIDLFLSSIDGLLSVLEATNEDGRAGALEWAAVVVLPALRTNVDKMSAVLRENREAKQAPKVRR